MIEIALLVGGIILLSGVVALLLAVFLARLADSRNEKRRISKARWGGRKRAMRFRQYIDLIFDHMEAVEKAKRDERERAKENLESYKRNGPWDF